MHRILLITVVIWCRLRIILHRERLIATLPLHLYMTVYGLHLLRVQLIPTHLVRDNIVRSLNKRRVILQIIALRRVGGRIEYAAPIFAFHHDLRFHYGLADVLAAAVYVRVIKATIYLPIIWIITIILVRLVVIIRRRVGIIIVAAGPAAVIVRRPVVLVAQGYDEA